MDNWYYKVCLVAPTRHAAVTKGAQLAALGPWADKYRLVKHSKREWHVLAIVHGKAVWDGEVRRIADGMPFGQETLIG